MSLTERRQTSCSGIFAGLGSEVHLVFRQPLPLRGFDDEVSGHGCAIGLTSVPKAVLSEQAAAAAHKAGHSTRFALHPTCPVLPCQVRKFASEQYAQNGLHLHGLTTPEKLEKRPNGVAGAVC